MRVTIIKNIIKGSMTTFFLAAILLTSNAAVFAATIPASESQTQACNGLNQLPGAGCGAATGTSVMTTVANIVSFISVLAGVIVIIMVIFAGFQYVTSGGDANKIGKAKTSLIYALVGLVIVALSQFLVHFVITKSAGG